MTEQGLGGKGGKIITHITMLSYLVIYLKLHSRLHGPLNKWQTREGPCSHIMYVNYNTHTSQCFFNFLQCLYHFTIKLQRRVCNVWACRVILHSLRSLQWKWKEASCSPPSRPLNPVVRWLHLGASSPFSSELHISIVEYDVHLEDKWLQEKKAPNYNELASTEVRGLMHTDG